MKSPHITHILSFHIDLSSTLTNYYPFIFPPMTLNLFPFLQHTIKYCIKTLVNSYLPLCSTHYYPLPFPEDAMKSPTARHTLFHPSLYPFPISPLQHKLTLEMMTKDVSLMETKIAEAKKKVRGVFVKWLFTL